MKKSIIFLLLVVLGISCSKDFLDRGPISVETSSNFYSNDDNALAALYATYNVIRGQETYGENKWVIGDIASDLSEGGGQPGGNDLPDIQDFDRLTFDARNTRVVEGTWFGYYAGLLRANLVIDNIEGNENITPALRDRIVGEAYTLRALFHFELVMTFGAVPIVNHVWTSDEYSSPVRQPISEVFAQIYSDLDHAIELLDQFRGTRIAGRMDVSSAIGLKIKTLVFESSYAENYPGDERFANCEQRWSEAQTLANDFIANAASYGVGLDADYAMIWREAYETSGEKLIVASSARLAGYEGPQISTGVTQPYEVGPSINVFVCVMQGPRTFYRSLTRDPEATRDGWGFNVPSQKFVDMFDPGDPRLDISVVFDQDPWNFWDYGNCFLATNQSPTGYSCQKYVMDSIEFYPTGTNNHASNLDYKILRYADVLLLGAEANLKAGNSAEALRLINLVRERARNSGVTVQPINLTTITMDDIIKERALELGLEGHRYFDLVRMARTNEMSGTNNYNATIDQNISFVVGKHEFLPVPDGEIVRSQGSLTQNNGY